MTTIFYFVLVAIIEITIYVIARDANQNLTIKLICTILFFLIPIAAPFIQAASDLYAKSDKIWQAIGRMDQWQKLFFIWGVILFGFGQTKFSFPDTSFGASFFLTYAQPFSSQISVAFIFSSIISFTNEYPKLPPSPEKVESTEN